MTGRQTLIIAGGSMEPALPIGAAVVVEPVPATALAVGDVVSLRTGTELKSIFTHRITRFVARADGLWVETKGDANASVDPSITPASQVIGRVDARDPVRRLPAGAAVGSRAVSSWSCSWPPCCSR